MPRNIDADLPTTRERAVIENRREIAASDIVRNTRTGEVHVDSVSQAVTFEGKRIGAEPSRKLAFSSRYLIG